MNDLEARLRSLTFRTPPSGLRGAVLASTHAPGWKNWLAPHPAAWLALAALWLAVLGIDSLLNAPGPISQHHQVMLATPAPQAPVLLAFYQQAGAVDLAR